MRTRSVINDAQIVHQPPLHRMNSIRVFLPRKPTVSYSMRSEHCCSGTKKRSPDLAAMPPQRPRIRLMHAEFLSVVDLIFTVFKSLQLKNFKARLSFRDPYSDKYIGSDDAWEKAQGAIRRAVQELSMDYFEAPGEAAFYGPKLDFIFQDALEREWQLGTVQVDYNLPERFDLEYTAPDGSRQRPVMIHRAPFGSLERLIGILIEEYAGDFPLWLAPIQVRLLAVSDEFLPFAQSVAQQMQLLGLRAEVDTSGERLGKMIRNAEKQKIPVMAVIWAKEVEANALNIRTRASGELGAIAVGEVIETLQSTIQEHGTW